MNRSTWVALVIVIAVGAVTGWYSVQLQRYNMAGLPPRQVEPGLLVLSAVPTGLLLAASVVRRRSAAMQVTVAVMTAAVGLGRVLVMRGELAEEWDRGKGLESGLAWAAGVVAAGGVLVVAASAAVWESVRRNRVERSDTAG